MLAVDHGYTKEMLGEDRKHKYSLITGKPVKVEDPNDPKPKCERKPKKEPADGEDDIVRVSRTSLRSGDRRASSSNSR